MMKTNKYISLITIMLMFCLADQCFATKNSNIFFQNKNDGFIDSTFKFWTNTPNAFIGIDTNLIKLQFRNIQVDTLSYNIVELKFINQINSFTEIFPENVFAKQYVVFDNNNTRLYNQELMGFENLTYLNNANNMTYTIDFQDTVLNFDFSSHKPKPSYNIKLKISGIDSIKYVSSIDSSLKIFYKNDYFLLNKLNAIQVDSLNDSTIIGFNYTFSNDTVSFNFLSSLDSNKVLFLEPLLIESNDTNLNNNIYSLKSENYYLDDKISYIGTVANKKFIFSEKLLFSNDYWRNLSYNTTHKFGTDSITYLYYESYDDFDNILSIKVLSRKTINDTISFKTIKSDNFKNSIITGYSNYNFIEENEYLIKDTTKNQFNDSTDALFLLYVNQLGDLNNAYFINLFGLQSLNIDYHVSDFIVDNFDIYLVGSGDFKVNDSLLFKGKQSDLYVKNSNQKGFIIQFNTFFNSVTNYFLMGHDGGPDEFVHLNSINKVYDSSVNEDVFIIGGLTNSTSILDTNYWNKGYTDIDNLILKTNFTFDTLLSVITINGNMEEGSQSISYYSHVNPIIINSKNNIVFWGQTTSSSFGYSGVLSNSKEGSDLDIFAIEMDLNGNVFKQLFLDGSMDDYLCSVQLYNKDFFSLLKTKSNNFLLTDNLSQIFLDTNSSNTIYNKGFLLRVNEELFTDGEYKPKSTNYIESSNSNLDILNILNISYDSILLSFNLSSSNILQFNNFKLNNNYNNNFKDGCILKIKRDY